MWEVYTYGGGDYLVEIFRSVALFFGGPFQSLAQVAGLFGLAAILMSYLGPRHGLDVAYILRFAVFYGALFVPKADIAVIDRITPGLIGVGGGVVNQVPLGLAVFAHFTSYIGDRLTTLYETNMGFPADNRYASNGLVFGATLLKNAPLSNFSDATFSGDMATFLDICAGSLFANNPNYIEVIEKSQDVWAQFLLDAQTNRFVQISTFAGPVSCATAANDINGRITDQENKAAANLGKVMWPWKDVITAQNDMTAMLSPIAQDMAGFNQASSQMLRQAMMANAIEASLDRLPPDAAAGAMAAIQAKTAAEKSRQNIYMTMGATASRSIPLLRSILEAIAYGLFPVVGVMILLPMGMIAFLNYFMVLMWLQMWPVLYAVLNSIIYWYAQRANSTGAMMPTGLTDWTIWSMPGIMETNSEIVALAGYMAISIPMISYMLIRGGAQIGSQVASSLTQPAQQAATQAGSQAALGNFQSGNVSLDTLTANSTSAWNRTERVSSHDMNNAYKTDTSITNVTGTQGERVETGYGNYTMATKRDGTALLNTEGHRMMTDLQVHGEKAPGKLEAYFQESKEFDKKSGFDVSYADNTREHRANSISSTLNTSQIEEMQRRHTEGVDQSYQAIQRWGRGGKFDSATESAEVYSWYSKLGEEEKRAVHAQLGASIGADGKVENASGQSESIRTGEHGMGKGSDKGPSTKGADKSWAKTKSSDVLLRKVMGVLGAVDAGAKGTQDNSTTQGYGDEERKQSTHKNLENLFASIEKAAITNVAEKTTDDKIKTAAIRWQSSLDDKSVLESSHDLDFASKQTAGREKRQQEQAGLRMAVQDPVLMGHTAENIIRKENPGWNDKEVFGEVVRRLNQSPEFVYEVARAAYWENKEQLEHATWANKIPEPESPYSVTQTANEEMGAFKQDGEKEVNQHKADSNRTVSQLTNLNPQTPLPQVHAEIAKVQEESTARYAGLKDTGDVKAGTNNVVSALYHNNEGGFLSDLSYAIFGGWTNKSPNDYENVILTAAENNAGFREQLKRYADHDRLPDKDELNQIFKTAKKINDGK